MIKIDWRRGLATAGGGKTVAVIMFLLLLRLAACALVPLTDPSEARYATIARQMAESGNYIMPQIWLDGRLIPFMSKPPFAFWLMAGSIKIFGPNAFAVRLPSFIAYLLLLAVIFHVISSYRSRKVAIYAVLIAATTAGLYLMSGVALVDTWLCLFSIGAVFFYFAFSAEREHRRRKLYSIAVFVMLGLGFITKGPVALIFFGVPVFFWTLLNRRWAILKEHAWLTGGTAFLLITLPWFLLAEKSTPGFLRYFFIDENFYRFFSPDKSHDLYSPVSHHLPPGMAIIFSLIVCLPWVLVQLFYYLRSKSSYREVIDAVKEGWRGVLSLRKCAEAGKYDIFLTGLISLAIFWSFSAHIMLYYMTLVTPLFAVWCAEYLLRCRVSTRLLSQIATIILLCYTIAHIPAYFFLSRSKSTASIVARARKLRQAEGSRGKLIFVRRMAYSGYFYGWELVVPHGKETVMTSLRRRSAAGRDIYIIQQRYLKKIPAAIRQHYRPLYGDAYWVLWLGRACRNGKRGRSGRTVTHP